MNNNLMDIFKMLTENMSDSDFTAIDYNTDISSALAVYRVLNHLTQKQMAEKIGVTQSMISKYESGLYNFTIKNIANIAKKLDMDFKVSLSPKKCPGENSSFCDITDSESKVEDFDRSDALAQELLKSEQPNLSDDQFKSFALPGAA